MNCESQQIYMYQQNQNDSLIILMQYIQFSDIGENKMKSMQVYSIQLPKVLCTLLKEQKNGLNRGDLEQYYCAPQMPQIKRKYYTIPSNWVLESGRLLNWEMGGSKTAIQNSISPRFQKKRQNKQIIINEFKQHDSHRDIDIFKVQRCLQKREKIISSIRQAKLQKQGGVDVNRYLKKVYTRKIPNFHHYQQKSYCFRPFSHDVCLGCLERLNKFDVLKTSQKFILMSYQQLMIYDYIQASICALMNDGSGFIFVVKMLISDENIGFYISKTSKGQIYKRISSCFHAIRSLKKGRGNIQVDFLPVDHQNQPSYVIKIKLCSPSVLSAFYYANHNLTNKHFQYSIYKVVHSEKQCFGMVPNRLSSNQQYQFILRHSHPIRWIQVHEKGAEGHSPQRNSTEALLAQNIISYSFQQSQTYDQCLSYSAKTLLVFRKSLKEAIVSNVRYILLKNQISYASCFPYPKQNLKQQRICWLISHNEKHLTIYNLIKPFNKLQVIDYLAVSSNLSANRNQLQLYRKQLEATFNRKLETKSNWQKYEEIQTKTAIIIQMHSIKESIYMYILLLKFQAREIRFLREEYVKSFRLDLSGPPLLP